MSLSTIIGVSVFFTVTFVKDFLLVINNNYGNQNIVKINANIINRSIQSDYKGKRYYLTLCLKNKKKELMVSKSLFEKYNQNEKFNEFMTEGCLGIIY